MSKLTRALAELAKRADAGDEAAVEGIRAYHGSPYSFDEFSTSQIGTGEGAQAYGRGLYFAEREKTAEGYRKAGTGSRVKIDGEDLLSPKSRELAIKDQEYNNAVGFLSVYGDADQAMRAAADNDLPEVADRIKSLVDSGRITTTSKGSMYEVNIDATPDEFIDWDLPLDEQSESVMNALKKTDWYQYAEEGAINAAARRRDNAYGMDLVRYLEEDGAEDAAQMLKDAGIKGVQYADASTRHKSPDKQSFNYVVFDDKLIDITKKYGVSVPIAAAIAAGTITPEEAQAGPLSATGKSLSAIKAKYPEVLLDVYEAGNNITISKMIVPPDQQGSGIGAQIVSDLTEYADQEGKPLALTPTTDFGATSLSRLKKFYKEQGFIENKGKKKDFEISESMYKPVGAATAATVGGTASADTGGMGVRMPPAAEDEEAMLAPTGGDLMQQANRDFASSIRTQPEPDLLTSVQQQLLSGIMKTAGVADLSADVVSAMAGPLLSAPGAIARYAADRYVPGVNYSAEEMAQGRRETEDYFNYQPRTEQGQQYGEQIMQGIGGAIAPYVPAIKKAAGDSYILGAMRQGYDYLGEREKELAKALMDLSPI